MVRKKSKAGQMNLSFGMIFTIILIIVFIAFAFYAIGKFLNIQKAAKTAQFIDAFETDVNRMWKSSQGSQQINYSVPSSVDYLCFTDFSSGSGKRGENSKFYDELRRVYFDKNNMFFYPVGSAGGIDAVKIENIYLSEITSKENPYCIKSINDKIKLTLKKNVDESLVKIIR
jgi:hypothetical protein